MSTELEAIKAKEDLRRLVDDYASLSDEKKIAEVMQLFTKDATYTVYMNGNIIAQTSGTDKLEKEFNQHASLVKTYFTLNGQHTVDVKDSTASGISFSQLKMVREQDGVDHLTDYSVRYIDKYVLRNGAWLIQERVGHFLIIESRSLRNS